MKPANEMYQRFINKYSIDDMKSSKELRDIYDFLYPLKDVQIIPPHSAKMGNLIKKYLG